MLRLEELGAPVLGQRLRDAEEDAADAKDPAVRAAAELTLYQLREVQAAIGAGR